MNASTPLYLQLLGFFRQHSRARDWRHLKTLGWMVTPLDSFKTLEELQIKLGQLLSELTPEIIAGITGYPFILDALSVVNTI